MLAKISSFKVKVENLNKWKLNNDRMKNDMLLKNNSKYIKWKIIKPFLALKKNRILLISSKFFNSLFVNKYFYNITRVNQSLHFNWKYKDIHYNFWEYKSTYFRFDYYLFLKKKKKKLVQGLPHLLRFFRYNKSFLYNGKINLNNNLNFISLIKNVNYSKIFNRLSSNSKTIYKKDLLYYFWIWKLITLNNKNITKTTNLVFTKSINSISKSFYDTNNYFLTKFFLKTYKEYYLKLFQLKKNLIFKVNKKLVNKLFVRNLFWKYYQNKFFKKYQNLNNNNFDATNLYTLKNVGVVNIFISLNNTFVTLSNLNGDVLYNAWGGILGIKGNKRSTPTASEAIAKKVGLIANEKGIKYIYLKLNGVLYTRKMKSAIKGFLTATNLKILRVINLTPKAHNGIRRKKIKKV